MEVILADVDPDLKIEKSDDEEEYDALSSLERDVLRRTQQAHQILLRQRGQQQQQPQQPSQQQLPPPQQQQHHYISHRTPPLTHA